MIPPGVHPQCHKMFITVPEQESNESKKTKKKAKENKSNVQRGRDVSEMLTKGK